MKSLWKRGLLILGGVILMTAAACTKEPIPDNRTKEQYELEQEFQPLFDFLAEEKKDFSKISKYKSTLFETERKTNIEKSYGVNFDKLIYSKDGTYTITEDGKAVEYLVSVNENNKLFYPSSVPIEYDDNLFNLHLEKDLFEKLPISDYTAEHPETYLKDISYEVDSSIPFLKQLMERYDINQNADISLYIENYYEGDDMVYVIRISLVDDYKIFDIINKITFRE